MVNDGHIYFKTGTPIHQVWALLHETNIPNYAQDMYRILWMKLVTWIKHKNFQTSPLVYIHMRFLVSTVLYKRYVMICTPTEVRLYLFPTENLVYFCVGSFSNKTLGISFRHF